MAASPADVLKLGQQNNAQFFDIRFSDLPGLMQHFSMPFDEITEEAFEEGFGFDGSSIRGFQEIQESDMILVPDPDTAVMDPFRQHPTLSSTRSSRTRSPASSTRVTRATSRKKAEDYLKGTGIADTAYFGPEAEFYIFDSIRFDQNQHSSVPLHRRGRRRVELGGRGGRQATSATSLATRRATSRFLRWTTTRTCAPRWCSPCASSASPSRSITTRSVPPARPRSTWASARCSRWPTG